MSATAPSDLGAGLERFLAAEWGEPVRVELVGRASAGARRRNILFDARRGGATLELVATIMPSRAMQIVPVTVEAGALRFAEAAGMPVPHVHAVCDDDDFVGGPFFVGTRIEGETIPRQILRLVDATPGLGDVLARQCGRALAALHLADPDGAPEGLRRPEKSVVEDALAGVERLLRGLIQPSPALALAFRWLERHAPPSSGRPTVVHSDFRHGNIIVGADGLRAALDWEGCRMGEPMEDLAWACVRMWRFRNDELEVGGFGHRAQLREGYEKAGGEWIDEAFHWWKVLGTVRWGLGLAGQAMQHLDHTYRSIVMAASGRRVAELEYDALMLVQRDYR